MTEHWITLPVQAPTKPAVPKTAQALADEAFDLKALKKSVEDAAAVSGTLWISYLFTIFYLSLATAAVTHEDLFFGRGVKLPFLGIDLPLKGFFVLGPLIFLIVHAYVLLHFALLARKTAAFHRELETQIAGAGPNEATRAGLRGQLPSNIFVQFLAGPRDVRGGLFGWLLRLIAWISLALGPVALLVFFQFQFLPYHDEAITWWNRLAVLAEILLLWFLWPAIVSVANNVDATPPDTETQPEAASPPTPVTPAKAGVQPRRPTNPATDVPAWLSRPFLPWLRAKSTALACSAAPLLLVFTVATFPGEWLHIILPSIRFPIARPFEQRSSLHELLVGGLVEPVTGQPRSRFPNVLILPDLQAVDRTKFDSEEKIKSSAATIILRGRNLDGAYLRGANLRKADLSGASLRA